VLARELALSKSILALQGQLDMLLAAATTGSGETLSPTDSGRTY
jgi:hypothetical protein